MHTSQMNFQKNSEKEQPESEKGTGVKIMKGQFKGKPERLKRLTAGK